MDARDPMERLSSAYRVEVDEGTKTRHLAEMSAALKEAPPKPVPAGFALRRRLAGALAAVFVIATPVGLAVAAEDSVPSDVLYPMKQITERVRSVFDDEVEATHRVEEVERLVFLRAPQAAITRAVERAESATSELSERDALASRLESVRRRLQEQDEEERSQREVQESQSREGGETSPQGESEQQNVAPDPGRQNGPDVSSGTSGTGTQSSRPDEGSASTTPPAQSGASGEGAGDRSPGGSPPAPPSDEGGTSGTGGSGGGSQGT